MKLLFITSQLPYPPQGGGVIKSFRLLQHLSEHFELSLLCNMKGEDPLNESAFLQQVSLADYHSVEVQKSRSARGFIASYLQSKTLNEWRNYSAQMVELVQKQSFNKDLIVVDHYEMFQFIPENLKTPVVLHAHNAEHMMWQRFAQLSGQWFKKKMLHFESNRIRQAEAAACRRSRLVWAAPADIDALKEALAEAEGLAFAPTYHLGNDEFLERKDLDFNNAGKAVLFFGSLSWHANLDGMLWFLESVWPLVLEKEPEVLLYVVGKQPPVELRKCAKKAGRVVFTGFVQDLDEYFEKCRVFINPVRFGSGIKVKMLDAMYRGLPSVSTAVGAESIKITSGKDYFAAKTETDWVEAISILLNDASIWKQMSVNARQLAFKEYRWQPMLKAHLKELEECIANPQMPAHAV